MNYLILHKNCYHINIFLFYYIKHLRVHSKSRTIFQFDIIYSDFHAFLCVEKKRNFFEKFLLDYITCLVGRITISFTALSDGIERTFSTTSAIRSEEMPY